MYIIHEPLLNGNSLTHPMHISWSICSPSVSVTVGSVSWLIEMYSTCDITWQRLIVAVLICSEFHQQMESGDVTFFIWMFHNTICFSNGTWDGFYKGKNENIKEWRWFGGINITSRGLNLISCWPIYFTSSDENSENSGQKTGFKPLEPAIFLTNVFLKVIFSIKPRKMSFHFLEKSVSVENVNVFGKNIHLSLTQLQTNHANLTDIPNVTHHVTCVVPRSKHKKSAFSILTGNK